ncbi:MAG TPA: GNAT family N-acetyltransferase, partial [Roseiflexaceae bacterium]|nr:GNAT family N-acetyltransferase [Roseiflexaceae bacterium]
MLSIRRYQSTDAAAVSAIIRTTMQRSNTADYPLEQLQPLIDYFSPEKVEQISYDRICLVAEVDGVLVATAALEGDELATFFVLPDQQGCGIGAALLAELEAFARSNGLQMLRVDASLTGAAFYERHGYRRTGVIRAGTAGPQVAMRKRLGD